MVLKLRSEGMNCLDVVATKTSLQLEPGKSMRIHTCAQNVSGPRDSGTHKAQETSAQARPLRKGTFQFSSCELVTGVKSKASLLLWHEMISHQNCCCWWPAQSQYPVCEQEALMCAYHVGPQSNFLGDEDFLSK